MSQAKKRNLKFGEFIMLYRKIILLALFFVILPIVIVIGVYSGTKANGQKVQFTEESEYMSTKKFIKLEDFTDFDLDVHYYSREDLYNVVEDEADKKQIGHTYTFRFTYKNIDDAPSVEGVSVTPTMVGPWSTYSLMSPNVALNEGTARSVPFKFEKITPYSPLLFVNVTHPMLYLELKFKIAGLEQIRYVSYDFSTDNRVIIK